MREYPIEKLLEIKEQIRNLEYKDYDYIGVRVQEMPFKLGELVPDSSVWVDGEETDERLDGACALDVTQFTENTKNRYFGDYMAIIGGYEMEYGQDEKEIIIKNAEVIEIL